MITLKIKSVLEKGVTHKYKYKKTLKKAQIKEVEEALNESLQLLYDDGEIESLKDEKNTIESLLYYSDFVENCEI